MTNTLTPEALLAMSPAERKALVRPPRVEDNETLNVMLCAFCFRCKRCANCDDCMDCTNCVHCSGCERCSGCSGCLRCKDCIGISNGEDLQYVAYGVQLTKEQWQEMRQQD